MKKKLIIKSFMTVFCFLLVACSGSTPNPEDEQNDYNLAMTLFDCPLEWTALTECQTKSSNVVGEDENVVVQIILSSQSGESTSGKLITLESDLVQLSGNGAVTTNSQGIGWLAISHAGVEGAGYLSASSEQATKALYIETRNNDLSLGISNGDTFEQGKISTQLPEGSLLSTSGSTILSVYVLDESGTPYTKSTTVYFYSRCSSLEDSLADLTGHAYSNAQGVVQATYTNKGCEGSDVVYAALSEGGVPLASVSIPLASPELSDVQFIDASPSHIVLRGTGGAGRSEVGIIKFRVIDQAGNGVAGIPIQFSLTTTVGGLSLSQESAFSDSDGMVQTEVRSGTTPVTMRVQATATDENVSALSDLMTVSTGVADQNSVTLSAETYNSESLDYANKEVPIVISLADHFNNPVPDGTAPVFRTEGGYIHSACENGTESGTCTAVWASSEPIPDGNQIGSSACVGQDSLGSDVVIFNAGVMLPCPVAPRPATLLTPAFHGGFGPPYAGRVTILATAIGEESFVDENGDGVYGWVDRNGNGSFDSGEQETNYHDLTEAFVDDNEDGVFSLDSSVNQTDSYCYDRLQACLDPIGGQQEEFVDFGSDDGGLPAEPDGIFNLANGVYNGLLCSDEAEEMGICVKNLVQVRKSLHLVMSGSHAYIWIIPNGKDPYESGVYDDQIDSGIRAIDFRKASNGPGSYTLSIWIADINNNPIPAKSKISISSTNGELVGTTSFTVPNTNQFGPLLYQVSIKQESEPDDVTEGDVVVTVTTPGGKQSFRSIPVYDDPAPEEEE